MKIKLEKLNLDNAKDIFIFENENRTYFETCLPPRNNNYYNIVEFNKIIESLIKEQNNNECYMYVIKNDSDKIVGRINLFIIVDNGEKSAELGYRIGQKYNGQGIATEAVKLILKENIKVNKIIAGTSRDNIASQRVLEKNGFIFANIIEDYIEINGKLVDSLNYVKFY